ncbi:endonuclease 8-like 2 [Pelodiscus sinensis]|uniref:Endonuclease 8-like 2 n=1 Tax=Pelodiscus sinensis TaxID=13735 RepID=K7F633_PELSI|nr:endonuclease 8-like 2 [Pelodiscus sinensis]XP_006115888.1 endonuclease 8-like 2 [Pelodiscus sinensis]XP_025036886.1 endonuclease 8-like 2 [Pelodiscus sinensis]XP_025036887.1 endonuclease 8-like 2 [Pelodiscus sinensis]|eukprot:XP_006115887.1 endonuclease 8-like 2 [Pelodiscus sinensis]
MPEGPSVKRFQLLTAPFVGQVVAKVGGSSRQSSLQDLKAMRLQDSQVSGKNLFLAFCAALEAQPMKGSPSPVEEGPTPQGKADSGACSLRQAREREVDDVSLRSSEEHSVQRKQEPEGSEAPGDAWKWLRFHFGLFGSIRANEFARANKANKRGDWKDPVPRLVLHFDTTGFLVFYNCQIRWCTSPAVEPAADILSPEFHRGQALAALRQPTPICCTLLDQRYFSGLGNIIKNEILYLARIHPLSQGSLLAVSDLESLLDHAVQFSTDWLHKKLAGKGLHYQIYLKEKCPLGHEVMKGTFGPPDGFQRLSWWCPQCQPQVPPEGNKSTHPKSPSAE